jgi:hypothetical protein
MAGPGPRTAPRYSPEFKATAVRLSKPCRDIVQNVDCPRRM